MKFFALDPGRVFHSGHYFLPILDEAPGEKLHRLVYLAAILVVIHYAWIRKGDIFRLQGGYAPAIDIQPDLLHFAVDEAAASSEINPDREVVTGTIIIVEEKGDRNDLLLVFRQILSIFCSHHLI